MDGLAFLTNKYVIALAASIGGVLLTLLTQQILNKRGLFTYFVHHNRVGVSADDAIFGAVRVTWNDNPVPNLYSSTVELINRSLKDFADVVVRVHTSDTIFLTEKTEIVGTTHTASLTKDYVAQLRVATSKDATEAQKDLIRSTRDYLIPVMNRGQIIRFHYLSTAKGPTQPSIGLDVIHKGVRLRFRVSQNQILGVPQGNATLVGVILGFLLLGILIATVETVWVATLCALTYGLVAQLPGAWLIRVWRACRDWFGS